MLETKSLDELAARIGAAIENSPARDIEKNVKAMLGAGLARLDLVPRAEFDVQAQVLLKTREKARRAGTAPRGTRGAAGSARPQPLTERRKGASGRAPEMS